MKMLLTASMVVSCIAGTRASAITVPPTAVFGGVYSNGSNEYFSNSGDHSIASSQSIPNYGSASGAAIISIGDLAVSAADTVTQTVGQYGEPSSSAGSFVNVDYYFAVAGPTSTVDLTLSAMASIARSSIAIGSPELNDAGASYFQTIGIALMGPGTLVGGYSFNESNNQRLGTGIFASASAASVPYDQSYSESFAGSNTTSILTDTIYNIHVTLQNSISLYESPISRSANSNASISNVQLAVDTSSGGGAGNNAAAYSFVMASAVPEPKSWAMMVAGFGVIGSAMRRRRTSLTFC